MKTVSELARIVAPDRVGIAGAVRRMAITLTAKALWQLAGFVIDGKTEVVKAEPFAGIGISARPPTTGKPEAIVIMVGDANNPMVIAVRDEKTRAAIAGALAADETMLFNSAALVHIKANGTIEARSAGGVALPLATKADIEALRDYVRNQFSAVNGHIHTVVGGGTTAMVTVAVPGTAPTVPPPAPTGTTKLKGE